ncbi:ABC transporter permease [Emticicia sp. BO119]|uniref:ABC transporter permease n=1 Tax=Emticicia sp. BO119 TaxID=2757768 RepID=UPI0015EFE2FF|nr:ABC transporter permease [Emticicia sp. BO119]MBA4849340.1 ABC transporter permease [Emticicia sp. BO119]
MTKQPNNLSPPRWADKLLNAFLPPDLAEELQGDMHEQFEAQVEEVGLTKARWLYIWEVLLFCRPYYLKRRLNAQIISMNDYYFLINPTMISNYFKIAFRTLFNNKAYSAINIIGLSIGLAAAMLIILYTKDELSYDRFHANNPNIYRLTYQSFAPKGGMIYQTGNTGYLQGPRFAAGVPEIQSYVRYQAERRDMKLNNEIVSQEVFTTDPDFFNVFSFPLINGDATTALKQPKSVVVSENIAEKSFGTANALGKVLMVKENDKFEPYTVTGVVRKSPQNSSIKFDVLLPLKAGKEEMENSENWLSTSLNTFVLLNPKADAKAVATKVNSIFQIEAKEVRKLYAEKYEMNEQWVYSLQPFTDVHLNKDLNADNGLVDASNPAFSYILSGIALFILLIACINFVNLSIARSVKRAKEIGVRKVVGGGRSQLIFQFLGESFMLCSAAFLLAILLVWFTLPTFNQLANKVLMLNYLLDTKLILGYIGLFFLTGLLAGFYPALVLSGYNPVQTLYQRFTFSGKNYLQKLLVVVQFSLASFMIIAAITIYSQLNYLTNKDLGYDDKQVISLRKPNLTRKEAQLLKAELLRNPDILAVAPKNNGFWGTSAKINIDQTLSFAYETVDESFLPMFKIPIVKGRNFSPDFPTDSSQSVLVNEAFVRYANWKDPIGQTLTISYNNNEKYKVIGVVKDYHSRPLNYEIKGQVFTMRQGNDYGKSFIKVKPNTETASLQYIEKTFKKLFPMNPYTYQFVEEINKENYADEAKWRQIMIFGAILTIFISCIGLFGLATLTAERRTKEIGIRKVLGASVSSVVQLLSSDFIRLVGLSLVFAFPTAYYAIEKWLQNYPYRVSISIWPFVITALIAIMIAFFTVSIQSIRAALMNPIKSLKNE